MSHLLVNHPDNQEVKIHHPIHPQIAKDLWYIHLIRHIIHIKAVHLHHTEAAVSEDNNDHLHQLLILCIDKAHNIIKVLIIHRFLSTHLVTLVIILDLEVQGPLIVRQI